MTGPIESEILQRLLGYWEEKRGGRSFPARRDLDAMDFRFALGHVFLIDVEYAPLRFRYRLCGSVMTARTGYDLTGRLVDDIPVPETRALTLALYRRAVEERRPVHLVGARPLDDQTWRTEHVAMPLASDGDHIDMLFVGFVLLDPVSTAARG